MRADVPQWLIQAYVRSVQTAGSTLSKEQLADACYRVIETWSSADRSYHGLNHVIDVLTRLEELLPETHDPCLVRLAAWYHGIAFSASAEDAAAHTAGENIPSSATAAEYHLKDLGVDPEKATRVARLIRGLKRTDLKNPAETAQFHAVDIDELALRDAHLGTLAVDPQRYKKYLQKVSQEYAHIAPAEFLAARKAIVSRILARRQIFVTPLARQWDAQARENLEAELERINRALALSAKSAAIEAARAENLEDAPTAGTPQEGPTAKAPRETKDFRSAIDSLLEASAEADAAEARALAKFAAQSSRLPDACAPKPLTVHSSMEASFDRADPGCKPIEPQTAEEKKLRRREEIAAAMRQRIAEKHQASARKPAADAAPVSPVPPALPASAPSAYSAHTATSAYSAHTATSAASAHSARTAASALSARTAQTAPSASTPNSAAIPTHGIEREPTI